ncbi:MAG TPA: hypothetical protein VGO56_11380 [Pyrinomonadaceae bacterium]|jgi:hypothetical protein|nr:hypothetical protein [Pyrinomonadaceae bacterium]
MTSSHKKSQLLSVALLGLAVILPACTHQKVVHVGSHKVTVSRHGFEKRLQVAQEDTLATLEYAGVSTDGKGLKVSIKGDQVTVNGVPGTLRPGDSVMIGDEGVAVNSMDYGQSEKYLRANGSSSQSTAQN